AVHLVHAAQAQQQVLRGDDGELRREVLRVHVCGQLRQVPDALGRRQNDPFDLTHVDELAVAGQLGPRPHLTLIAEDVLVRDRPPPLRQDEPPLVIDTVVNGHCTSSSPCRDSFPLTPRLPTPQELLWSAGGVRARLSRVRLLPTAEDRVMRNLALEARRRFLVVSATAGLGSLLRLQADAASPRSATADACILLFLNGGMSH